MDFAKSHWTDLWRSSPGKRFQARYQHSRRSGPSSTLVHVTRITLGVTTGALGLVLLVTPGPGLLFLVIGGSFLASESLSIAQRLDQWELVARDRAERVWNYTSQYRPKKRH